MTGPRIFITGMGIISPLGTGCPATLAALNREEKNIRPLSLFPIPHGTPLPVGEVTENIESSGLPRTHQLAEIAAREAVGDNNRPVDAIVIGTTTGGLPDTEARLMAGIDTPDAYRCHAAGSIAGHLAKLFACHGPVLTISTACSSGVAAFALARAILQNGLATRVLAGGADALCRLTYHGFNALQLIDPAGPRPFDHHRRGMAVGEGAAMLLLEAAQTPPAGAVAEFLGAGLSCDAYHPTAPHPEGAGARAAMQAALTDADVRPDQIDYIHLHGTGTPENDRAEARAVDRLFSSHPPAASSIKGATGHSLAAAGAVGAVISALALAHHLIPATAGLAEPDPDLPLRPVSTLIRRRYRRTMINAFGFGGNNAVAILGAVGSSGPRCRTHTPFERFSVRAWACLTGAGDTAESTARFRLGKSLAGQSPEAEFAAGLPAAARRRLKRLPRMVLALCVAAARQWAAGDAPRSIFLGTGWGALTETHRFLTRLFESDERFASPIDFSGSVHNAPAGQAAIHLSATGPNLTLTGGDASFEQALFAAARLTDPATGPCIVIGADEYHPDYSPLFDASCRQSGRPADGGAAFCLTRTADSRRPTLDLLFYGRAEKRPQTISDLAAAVNSATSHGIGYDAILYGVPMCYDESGRQQLALLTRSLHHRVPGIAYRPYTGEFATAAGVATALALDLVSRSAIPAALTGGDPLALTHHGLLVIGLGDDVSAIMVRA